MDRRKFLKNTGWSFLGLAASGSLLGACAPGSKDAKKIMPSASDLKMYWGDLRSEERRVGKECRSRWSPYH